MDCNFLYPPARDLSAGRSACEFYLFNDNLYDRFICVVPFYSMITVIYTLVFNFDSYNATRQKALPMIIVTNSYSLHHGMLAVSRVLDTLPQPLIVLFVLHVR